MSSLLQRDVVHHHTVHQGEHEENTHDGEFFLLKDFLSHTNYCPTGQIQTGRYCLYMQGIHFGWQGPGGNLLPVQLCTCHSQLLTCAKIEIG